jgi:hypothetical protein
MARRQTLKPWVIFAGCVLVIVVLYWAQAVLVPIALALLLTFVWSSVCQGHEEHADLALEPVADSYRSIEPLNTGTTPTFSVTGSHPGGRTARLGLMSYRGLAPPDRAALGSAR